VWGSAEPIRPQNRAMSENSPSPVAFEPPPMEALLRYAAPLKQFLSPVALGLERVPREGAVLLVGNHTVYGALDMPMFILEFYEKTGRMVRALGDHFHFDLPVWGDLARKFGVVDGTRENCASLFRAGEPVLVFPGGGREVMKRKGEKYKLVWKERVGFARMAIQFGVPIVPFASVGVEDMFEIVSDANDVLESRVGDLLRTLGIVDQEWFRHGEMIPPLVRSAHGLGPIPRLERQYFLFGQPIDTRRFAGRHEDRETCEKLRDQVKTVIEQEVHQLEEIRDADPERYPVQRLLRHLASRFG
jgi:1-acyl-sn-glycerol-3-phosphate acyltransferase